MSIGGYSNNFNATIDGLNNFVLDYVTCNTLVVKNTITLPNASILDNYLTTNIPKKNQNNTAPTLSPITQSQRSYSM